MAEEKKVVKEQEFDIKKMLKDLGNTDWAKDNESQMKAVQIMKGLALSDDKLANGFMKELHTAAKGIIKGFVENSEKDFKKNGQYLYMDSKEENKKKMNESVISLANSVL